MRKILLFSILPVLVLCGCSATKPLISPSLVQQGVRASVSYGVAKYPSALPFVRASEPIICAASEGTNLAPAQVVAAIQQADILKTPESVFIVNSALLLYEGIYNAYGSNAVNNAAMLRDYLHATCLGIGQGLQPGGVVAAPLLQLNWPQVK